jgi:Kef-type K+ transport system membrane component KefB
VIGLANIGTPLLAGAALAVPLYARYAPPGVGLPAFALFLGVCLSITAFPVLARILSDLGIQRTAVGSMALACAAMGDIVALALVAILAGVAGTGGGDVILSVGLACVFLVSVALRAATVGAAAAPAGAAPEGSEPESGLPWAVGRLRDLLVALVLPAFFAYSGLRTDIGLVSDPSDWTACFAIVAGAVLGKLGGAYAAGRAVGLGARDSAAVGILLNTRGLMELVVIGIGLEIGIISPALFTMLVVMALVTTFATVPLLGLVLPSSPSATPGGRAG